MNFSPAYPRSLEIPWCAWGVLKLHVQEFLQYTHLDSRITFRSSYTTLIWHTCFLKHSRHNAYYCGHVFMRTTVHPDYTQDLRLSRIHSMHTSPGTYAFQNILDTCSGRQYNCTHVFMYRQSTQNIYRTKAFNILINWPFFPKYTPRSKNTRSTDLRLHLFVH